MWGCGVGDTRADAAGQEATGPETTGTGALRPGTHWLCERRSKDGVGSQEGLQVERVEDRRGMKGERPMD